MDQFAGIVRLLEYNQRKEAVQELIRLLDQNPQYTDAWFLLAKILDDPSMKADCYKRVLSYDPHNEVAYKALAHQKTVPIKWARTSQGTFTSEGQLNQPTNQAGPIAADKIQNLLATPPLLPLIRQVEAPKKPFYYDPESSDIFDATGSLNTFPSLADHRRTLPLVAIISLAAILVIVVVLIIISLPRIGDALPGLFDRRLVNPTSTPVINRLPTEIATLPKPTQTPIQQASLHYPEAICDLIPPQEQMPEGMSSEDIDLPHMELQNGTTFCSGGYRRTVIVEEKAGFVLFQVYRSETETDAAQFYLDFVSRQYQSLHNNPKARTGVLKLDPIIASNTFILYPDTAEQAFYAQEILHSGNLSALVYIGLWGNKSQSDRILLQETLYFVNLLVANMKTAIGS